MYTLGLVIAGICIASGVLAVVLCMEQTLSDTPETW
jgi:hypothetical protein